MTSTGTVSPFETIIGIDISKDRLDIAALPGRQHHSFANTPAGHARFIAWIARHAPGPFLVFEATGACHRDIEQAIARAGLAHAKVNPARAKAFAKALGQSAKTDRLDAAMLAALGQSGLAAPAEPTSQTLYDLRELETALSGLIRQRAQARTRIHTQRLPAVRRMTRQLIALLGRQIEQLEARMLDLIGADPALKRKAGTLISIPGIGGRTAARLVCGMPELGELSGAQAASLSGTAPRTRQSGKRQARAFVHGGRAHIRRILYMPALIAARHNPDMKTLYQRLTEAGKPPKVALAAIMRKLVCLANALIKNNRKWTPQPA